MTEALPDLFETGMTTNEYFARIALARMINQASGGAVIAPWDVKKLDDIWLDAFRLLATDGKSFAAARQQVSAAKSAWLAKHPTYGKIQ